MTLNSLSLHLVNSPFGVNKNNSEMSLIKSFSPWKWATEDHSGMSMTKSLSSPPSPVPSLKTRNHKITIHMNFSLTRRLQTDRHQYDYLPACMLLGKYILICTCPNGQADFLSTSLFYTENGTNTHICKQCKNGLQMN